MRNDFAIFILTHERVKEQKTYEMLKRSGYAGKIFLVVDTDDKELEEYQRKYKDEVITFDKNKVWETTDTMFNKKKTTAVVFAKNVCSEIAKKKKLKYYAMCDDDVTELRYRYIKGKTLKFKKVKKNIDFLFDAVCEYLDNKNVAALAFSEQAAFVGGANGNYKKGINWHLSHFIFVKTEDNHKFRGFFYEDDISMFDLWNKGKVAFSTMLVDMQTAKTGSNKGGMAESYALDEYLYISAYSVFMAYPACMKITFRKGKFTKNKKMDMAVPKVISGRWKK